MGLLRRFLAAMWSASVIRDPSACQGLWDLVFAARHRCDVGCVLRSQECYVQCLRALLIFLVSHKDNCRTLFGFTRSHLRKKGTKQNRTEGTFRFNQYSPFHNYISDNLHKGGQGQFDSKGSHALPSPWLSIVSTAQQEESAARLLSVILMKQQEEPSACLLSTSF